MTAPRQVLPGTTYLITRRCFQRQFLLRPSQATNETFLYVLALAARRYGMLVHAFCVVSNHFHLVVTDPHARLPAFEQYLNALVARAVNAALGRWESFWAPSSYSAVALEAAAVIVSKTGYVLANPVAAGLVRDASDWPGLWSAPERIGGERLVAHRPTTFFRATGYLPDSVELELSVPPGFESVEAFQRELVVALQGAHERARARIEASGVGFLGRAKALAQNPYRSPASLEPRRQLRPRVASRDKWKRIEALSRISAFVDAYREALATLRRGFREVLFPAGTYLLRVQYGVRCSVPG
jgi:REP element-mobilizing transposase RayT